MTNSRSKYPIRLTARDYQLLYDLVVQRVITRDQLIGLGYFRSVSRCNSRLQQLVRARLVGRYCPSTAIGSQYLYAASHSAVQLLATKPEYALPEPWLPVAKTSPLTLTHTLGLVDLRIAFERPSQPTTIQFLRWLPEPLCRHQYSTRDHPLDPWQKHILKPDAHVRLSKDGQTFDFFLELDLGHVSRDHFRRKTCSYQHYLELDLFQEVYGRPNFRVLVVTTGLKRLRHLQSVAKTSKPQFLFGLQRDIRALGPYSSCWHSPDGHQHLIGGSL